MEASRYIVVDSLADGHAVALICDAHVPCREFDLPHAHRADIVKVGEQPLVLAVTTEPVDVPPIDAHDRHVRRRGRQQARPERFPVTLPGHTPQQCSQHQCLRDWVTIDAHRRQSGCGKGVAGQALRAAPDPLAKRKFRPRHGIAYRHPGHPRGRPAPVGGCVRMGQRTEGSRRLPEHAALDQGVHSRHLPGNRHGAPADRPLDLWVVEAGRDPKLPAGGAKATSLPGPRATTSSGSTLRYRAVHRANTTSGLVPHNRHGRLRIVSKAARRLSQPVSEVADCI